ncbi:MAG: TonB-dependent receptor [Alphaproteobacteria bacterium]|nr:TonB-dependent receptor [Alphaproteobacteria bacterium]
MNFRYLLLASATAIISQPAFAQTPADAAYGDIIVTAQKREQSINDIPLSITALSADQLANRRIDSAADLTRSVAGFNFADTGVNAPVYSLRGVGYFDYSLAAAPAVSVYMDEVALPYAAMTQGAAFDLERVEVLRGPQGTLFGQNATGGLINYIAKKPTDHFSAGASVGYGRFNRVDAGGYVSGPLGPTLKARLAVQTTQMDDWQYSYTRADTNGSINRTNGRLLLDWEATPDLKVSLNFNGYIDKSDPSATQVIAITPLTPARVLPAVATYPLAPQNARAADWSNTVHPYRDDKFWQASGRIDLNVGADMTLTSISAYSKLDTDDYIDRDGMDNDNSQYALKGQIKSFSQELRLSGKAGILNYVFGGTYSDSHTLENQTVNIATASNVQSVFGIKFSDASNRIKNDVTTWALFASGDWALADRLSLTTGIRYTKTKLDFVGCANATEPSAIAALGAISAYYRNLNSLPPVPYMTDQGCITLNNEFLAQEPRETLKEDNVSWRVALNYKVDDNVHLYSSVSRGFKAGNSITVAGSSVNQYVPVKQEELTSYEVGFKARLLDRRMQLNGSAFYYDYKNKQARSKTLDVVFGPLQALVNIPKSHAWGAELEMQLRPVDGFTISTGLAYLDTKIDNWSTGYDALGVQRDLAGHPFSFAPKWQANADVDYEYSIGESMKAFVGAGMTYHSSASADFNSGPLFAIDPYTLIDARLGLKDTKNGWRVSVWGKNLFNKYHWDSVIRVQDTVVRTPAMPATYGITLGFDM